MSDSTAGPKASLVLPDGTRVTIEGTADQVAALVNQVAGGNQVAGVSKSKSRARRRGTAATPTARPKTAAKGPADHIRDLIADGFFATKQGLGDVKDKLEERAHIYPITSLSPVLFRLVRLRELRRIKEAGVWKYVNP